MMKERYVEPYAHRWLEWAGDEAFQGPEGWTTHSPSSVSFANDTGIRMASLRRITEDDPPPVVTDQDDPSKKSSN